MIKVDPEYGLEGAFKADFYDANGDFVNSTDYFSNFITYSGLLYPLTYHFPECFKFLSLGSSASANTINTTGLGTALTLKSIDAFQNINYATQSLSYLGPEYYSEGNCGTSIAKDGPVYFRVWKIPSGDTAVAGENLVVKEFMVSPGSGTDSTGKFAFSRVAREVILKSGNSALLTYRLKLKIISTGINYLTGFDISQADLEDGALVTDWTGVTGIYRQVYHGLAAIDKKGNSFIPKYGDIMEPASVNQKKFAAYFSPDYSQFATNTVTGKQLSFSDSYKADGLFNVAFNHDYSNASVGEAKETYKLQKENLTEFPEKDKNYAKDIRYEEKFPNYNDFTGNLIDFNFKTQSFDYSQLALATPGNSGFNSESIDVRNKASVSAGIFTERFNPTGALQQNRKKTLSRKIIFTPNKSYGTNTRYGSFVYGFDNGGIWPAIDCIFFNKSGQLLMPHYRNFTGFHNFEVGSGIGTGKAVLSPAVNNYFNYNILANATGQVTGFIKTEDYKSGIFDRYLQRHSLVYNTEPAPTGAALHPSGYPHFENTNEIKLVYKDLQFFAKGLGYVPTGYYGFSPSKQVLHEVSFSGMSNTNLLKTPLRLSESLITGQNNTVSGGFFLSRLLFNYSGQENSLNHQDLLGAFDSVFTDQYVTGYLYSGNTLLTSFNIFAEEETLNLNQDTSIDVLRLNRLVNNSDSTGSAISSLNARGSGLLTLPNTVYNLRFSGEAPFSSTGLALSGWSSVACSDDGKTVVVGASNPNSYIYYNTSGGKLDAWSGLSEYAGQWVALSKSNNDALFHGVTKSGYHKIIIDPEKIPISCDKYGVAYINAGYSISGKVSGTTRTYTVSDYGVLNNSLFIKTGDLLQFDTPALEDYSVSGVTKTASGIGYDTGLYLYARGGEKPNGNIYDSNSDFALKLYISSTGESGSVNGFSVSHSGSYGSGVYFNEVSPFTWSPSEGAGEGFEASVNGFIRNDIRGSYFTTSTNLSTKTFTFTGSSYSDYQNLAQPSKLVFAISGNSGSFIDIDAYSKVYVLARAGRSEQIKRNFIFKSINSGNNWDLVYLDNGANNFKRMAASANGETICATRTFDKLLISNNAGSTWQSTGCEFNYSAIDISDNAEIIAVGTKADVENVNPGGYIYTSLDKGINWFCKRDAGLQNWKEVEVSSNGRRIIASATGYISKSFNFGKKWSSSEIHTGWDGLAMSSNGKTNFAVVSGGYVYAPLANSEKLYITYLENTGDYNWQGTTNLTGFPVYTQFCEPSGVPMHKEAGKLKPNNYTLGTTGNLLGVTEGGAYPGLSDRNNLEVQINMSWSSPCAGVTEGCTDP